MINNWLDVVTVAFAVLIAAALMACGPIYVVEGGGMAQPAYSQPDYSQDALRQGQRNNDLIMRCAGRAVDFVTGRCM